MRDEMEGEREKERKSVDIPAPSTLEDMAEIFMVAELIEDA